MDVEYVIMGSFPYYPSCLIYVCGKSKELAYQVLNRMRYNPNENDKMHIRNATKLWVEAVKSEDCWWNDNCD